MVYLEQIGASLAIVKAPKETLEDYYRRVAYSAVADWVQTAAFVGNEATSIVQLKSIAVAKVNMLQELSPGLLPYGADELVEHLYTILLDNGVFLHRDYYVRPAPHRLIGNDSFAIVRGMCPEEYVSFSISAFFEQHKYRVIRFYVYRRMFTPQEVEKQYIDQSVYESNTASIGMVREVISLPDGDVLLGIGGICEDVCDMNYLEYYRLSEIRLSYWPHDDYEYGATDEQPEEKE